MKEFRVNRKSWHYKIARFFAHSWDPDPKTFCQYWRNFILSALFLSVIGFFILLLMGALAMSIYSYPGTFVLTVGVIIALIVGIVALIWGSSKVQSAHNHAMTTENPGIFAAKYRSFKMKFCPPVTYED